MASEDHADADGGAEQRSRMGRALATGGFRDVLVTDRATAVKVPTEKRQELTARIRESDTESVRRRADDPDRDIPGVSRDRDLLAKNDIVEYETEGRRKIPHLKHQTVVAEPIA
jgi:hypothetical protein